VLGGNTSLVFATNFIYTKPAVCQCYFMALKRGYCWQTISKHCNLFTWVAHNKFCHKTSASWVQIWYHSYHQLSECQWCQSKEATCTIWVHSESNANMLAHQTL